MKESEKIALCRACTKRGFNSKTGIVCSLSLAKPDFDMTCDDYLLDPKVNKTASQTIEAMPNKSSNFKTVLGVILIIIGIIRLIMALNRM